MSEKTNNEKIETIIGVSICAIYIVALINFFVSFL